MPFRKLFLSRWSALLWAGGILWTAADTVGFGPPAQLHAKAADNAVTSNEDDTDATGVTVNEADLAALANVMSGK